jgi:hypothetical protein
MTNPSAVNAVIAIRADHLHSKFCSIMPEAAAAAKVCIYLSNLKFHWQHTPQIVQFLNLQIEAYSPQFNLITKKG